jgi:hypothetical protein
VGFAILGKPLQRVLGVVIIDKVAGSRRMESLPLGGTAIPTTMNHIDGSSY